MDVDRLKGLIARLPDLHVYTDSDQGHGWNEAAVHRQLAVLQDFFNGGGCGRNGSSASYPAAVASGASQTNGKTAANGRAAANGKAPANGRTAAGAPLVPSLLDTVEITLSPS